MASYGIKGKAEKRVEYMKHEPLPAGIYIGRIVDARPNMDLSQHINGLKVAFDIEEGEYKGFFTNDYKAAQAAGAEAKWRGTIVLWAPISDDQERNERTERAFCSNIWCINDSNPGLNIDPSDFDEKMLKGKLVGLNYRNREWEMNGQTGMTTECARFESVRDIRDGKVKQMKDRLLNGSVSRSKPATDFKPAADDEELPF